MSSQRKDRARTEKSQEQKRGSKEYEFLSFGSSKLLNVTFLSAMSHYFHSHSVVSHFS